MKNNNEIKLLEKYIRLTYDDEKTNCSFEFDVPERTEKLCIRFEYLPKILDNKEEAVKKAEECINRDASEFASSYERPDECLPLKNLITLSLDSPNGYRGAAHRQDEKQAHIISFDEASVGFIKGEIDCGKWFITLNVHAIVTAEVYAKLVVVGFPCAESYTLFPCELHCHTVHSDGQFTPESLVKTAAQRQLSGINLTDHNTISGYDYLPKTSLAVQKGIEWTTYFGHMLVLGADKFIDWRDATPDNIDCKMKQVKDANGLIGIAHPFQLGTPICTGGHWDFKVQDFSLVDYIEIWSEGHPYLTAANIRAIQWWHSLLDKGYRIAPTFGRDWHRDTDNILPSACTFLLSYDGKLTSKKMFDSIKNGKTIVSAGPEFLVYTSDNKTIGDTIKPGLTEFNFIVNLERIRNMGVKDSFVCEEIRVISNGGAVLSTVPVKEKTTIIDVASGHWYSAELWGKINGQGGNLLAVTAPIYSE